MAEIHLTGWQIATIMMAMITDLATVKEVIAALGGTAEVAVAAGVERNTVVCWQARHRIPVEHWAALVGLAEAKRQSIDHITLQRICRPRKPRSDRPEQPRPTRASEAAPSEVA